MNLRAVAKLANAKLAKRQGRGKTAFFSLLPDVDKTRVLELTEAPGAPEVALAVKKGNLKKPMTFSNFTCTAQTFERLFSA